MSNYSKGDVYPPNDCDIIKGTIDYRAKNETPWSSKIVVYGNSNEEVDNTITRIIDELNGTEVEQKAPDYAAAFNAWQDDYNANPQAFEDSHTTAIRHLTEKLNGEEPSYGAVCSVLFQEYLNKVKTQESK